MTELTREQVENWQSARVPEPAVTAQNLARALLAAWDREARLREALGYFLADDRFHVAVGGSPDVVENMIASARQIYGDTP